MSVYMSARHPLVALIDELHRTRGRLRSAFQPVEGSLGLSEIEMTVLNAVLGARTPPTVPQIGRSLGHARQVIQRAANALTERGLIGAADNPDHKRASLLHPTDRGLALKREADGRGEEIATALCAGIDVRSLREIAGGLHKIRLAIEANMKTRQEAPNP
jgi:DNA-binding MarR family transcriptional regulator